MLLCEWMLRPNGHPFDPYAVYSKFPSVFSLEIHHGGKLSEAPNRLYDGGEVNWFDQIDYDGFSVVEVNHMLKCLGYVNPTMEYWYKMHDKDILLQLSNDKDVLRFSKYVDRCKIMQLYVVHPVDKPKPLGDSEEVEETFDPLFCDLTLKLVKFLVKFLISNGLLELVDIPIDADISNGSDMRVKDRSITLENVDECGSRCNEVPVEDTQPVDTEVFEDLDLEDFDSASDPDDIECNRKKALRIWVSRLAVENVGDRSCKGQRGPQAYASVSAARPSGNHSQASQASVTPSTPTVSQSQTFVRPTPPLRLVAPSVRPSAPSNRQTLTFLRLTTPFVTPRFTKTSAKRISSIKKTAGANGKGKNVQE
ncbi:hypothetical protein Tco_0684274 [Tanacetum coccineum]